MAAEMKSRMTLSIALRILKAKPIGMVIGGTFEHMPSTPLRLALKKDNGLFPPLACVRVHITCPNFIETFKKTVAAQRQDLKHQGNLTKHIVAERIISNVPTSGTRNLRILLAIH